MRDIQIPGRSVVMSGQGMVASSQPMATQTGLEILRRGGNAMDAAIAASAVLCVTEPAMTGIGGDCFLLYHEAASARLYGLNGSGRAPSRATLEELHARGHEVMPERGILTVTVPGAVDAWCAALERFGTLSLDQVLQPAIAYAEEGYAVSPVVAQTWQRDEALLASFSDSYRALLVNGRAPAVGSRHHQPDLARSLRMIAEQGASVFYQGEIAEKIVAFSKAHDGLLELDDFAMHRSEWVQPLHTDYRGLRVYELPPNGQGVTALMILNILENANLRAMDHLSAEHIHTLTEAFRLAMAERDRFVSDPDFHNLPIEQLLSKDFAGRQWSRIDPQRALLHPVNSGLPEHRDTTYLTVVDRDRNAVSFINSLFYAWGSGLVAGDTGITLHARGSSFCLQEDHYNSIAPGKRPMHTIIPAIAYKGSQPVLVFGVMGGHYQAMGHSYLLSNWWDFGMDIQEAIDAPRFVAEADRLVLERPIPAATRQALASLGHRVVPAEKPLGGAQCIYLDPDHDLLHGASDGRKDGCALGY